MSKIFTELSAINVSKHIEQKQGLSYLSWTWAIETLEKYCDEHDYELEMDVDEDKCHNGMVYTHVTINGIRKNQWLPIMDYRNKAIENPTSTDVNKAYMRCLVKNIARWGLGMYVYAGEDLPNKDDSEPEMDKATGEVKESISKFTWKLLNQSYTRDEINEMKKECGVTRGDELTEEYAREKLKAKNDEFNKTNPPQVFY